MAKQQPEPPSPDVELDPGVAPETTTDTDPATFAYDLAGSSTLKAIAEAIKVPVDILQAYIVRKGQSIRITYDQTRLADAHVVSILADVVLHRDDLANLPEARPGGDE